MRKKSERFKKKCKVDGCDRMAMYIEKCLCQKHYFREFRTGSTNLSERRSKEKIITPNGYVRIKRKNHPLGNRGYVFEHRLKMYEVYGESLPNCALCGKKLNWKNSHIDHIDCDTLNNSFENLRPLCIGCNTKRSPRKSTPRYEFLGNLLTVTELSKIDGVNFCRAHLKKRIDAGMDLNEAMFGGNKTHPRRSSI